MVRRVSTTTLIVLAAIVSGSCGSLTQQGRSPSYLIIDSIVAASGAQPQLFGNVLSSDVQTLVKRTIAGQEVFIPTIFADNGQATVHIALKDQNVSSPTEVNLITIERYRVEFVRSDGRNRQGIDVPFAFDGAVTHTARSDTSTFSFTLVRVQAKEEPPLRTLVGGGGAIDISTIAIVTFYGRDQVGNEVSVTGRISVNFADWGDPQ